MRSMTGYGKSVYSGEDYLIEFEIKSVNSRFLELKIALPREINFMELEINNQIKDMINRGKVTGRINLVSFEPPELVINKNKLAAYSKVYNEIRQYTGNKEDIPLQLLLANEEIVYHNEDLTQNKKLKAKILEVISEGIAEHQASANREGKAMQDYMQKAFKLMMAALDKIEELFPEYKTEINDRMQTSAKTLFKGRLSDEDINRLSLEIAMYVEKADVTEEIVRLKHHIIKFGETIYLEQDTGKTLNFILQEMHREINTIGSKYSHNSIFEELLLIKEEIEKCRELVQNIV